MRDVSGKLLGEGDRVAFTMTSPGCLHLGRIVGFTPKMVKVKNTNGEYNRFPEQISLVSSIKGTA